nr:unnamed protein product [Digitaria exilis]
MMMATEANGEVPGEKKKGEQRNASTSPWTRAGSFPAAAAEAEADCVAAAAEQCASWSSLPLPCSARSRALLGWPHAGSPSKQLSHHHSLVPPSLTCSRKAGKLAPRGGNREGDALALAGRETRSLSGLPALSSSWQLSLSLLLRARACFLPREP